MANETLTAALAYLRAGLSILPIALDGEKKPCNDLLPWVPNDNGDGFHRGWKPLEKELPTLEYVQSTFGRRSPPGIGVISGKVSGNLELIDFDKNAHVIFPQWSESVEAESPGLLDRINIIETPRDPVGYHVRYRCPDFKIPGNMPLAMLDGKENKEQRKLIETRGEGGYGVAPGSPLKVHKTGRPYKHFRGVKLSLVGDISPAEREILIRNACVFNEEQPKNYRPPKTRTAEGLMPGEDYNARGPDWSQILEPHGWVFTLTNGSKRYWRRPGKDVGHSATTGCLSKSGHELLCVFTTNADCFPGPSGGQPCSTHDKFGAYVLLNHKGDFSEAAKALVKEGFGTKSSSRRNPAYNPSAAPSEPIAEGERVTFDGDQISPEDVDWVWLNRIPAGMLTTFAGQTSIGKTFVLCDIAARITRGDKWPDEAVERAPEGQVLFISGEDHIAKTLVPRLIQLGAVMKSMKFFTPKALGKFCLTDLSLLARGIAENGDVRLVVIDPPTAYLGDVDDHRNAELRSKVLAPLHFLSEEMEVAIILNTHVSKPQAAHMDAIMRVMGSVAWINAVRAAHVFCKDPEDKTRRFFIPLKVNIGDEGPGLAYRVKPLPDRKATIEWLGPVDIDADEAMNKDRRRKPPRHIEAHAWLEEVFTGIDELPSKEIWENRKETTVGEKLLKEAKDDMGIKARQEYDPEQGGFWIWEWPAAARARWRNRAQGEPGSDKGTWEDIPP